MPVVPGVSVGAHSAESVRSTPGLRWTSAHGWAASAEAVVTEAPLAIEISYERAGCEIINVLAVTMRTPGHDTELAIGFLRAEGLISSRADFSTVTKRSANARGEVLVTRRVQLARPPREDVSRVSRTLLTSSACGVCNRTSLEGLPRSNGEDVWASARLPANVVERLPEILREQQRIFSSTGGAHGAALCDEFGQVLLAREDVGRHNAVDKLTGAALLRELPLHRAVLVLSGRASFELVQKAAVAGIPIIAAVGAPSSLAVELAHAAGITLIGFARPGRFNVYTHAQRLDTRDGVEVPPGVGQHAPETVSST